MSEAPAVYTPEQFEALCKEFLETEQELMTWKADEYSDGIDRIENFRTVAGFLEITPAQVALAWLLKHIHSITLAVSGKDFSWAWETESGEGLKQRIADARNYLLLLAACIDADVVDR